ncbi:hypothetical protein V8D89_008804 [Ganoderma adspersum]
MQFAGRMRTTSKLAHPRRRYSCSGIGTIPPTQQRRKSSTVSFPRQLPVSVGGSVNVDSANITTSLKRGSTQWFHRRRISTLDPTKLTPDDYVDLSCRYSVHVTLSAHDYNPAYNASASISPTGWPDRTFPPDIRGFLYYRAPWGPPLAGELRFRVTPTPDPASFATGSDLVAPNGVPWNIPLYNIPFMTCHHGLQAQLLRDGLVPQRAFDVLASAAGIRCHRAMNTHIVTAFGQDFRLQFSESKSCSLLFAGADSVGRCTPRYAMGLFSTCADHAQFEGTAVCCFERSTLPEHAGKRVVVLRLKRILDQVSTPEIEEIRPREGGLLKSLLHGRVRVWALDVDRSRKNVVPMLKVLFENEERYGPLPLQNL